MGATPVYHADPTSPADYDPSVGYPPAHLRAELGRRIQSRMQAKGWTQSELARQSEMGRDSVSSYVRGRSMPGPLHLSRIAKALDCTTEDLLPGLTAATSARPGSAGDDALPLEIRQVAGVQVWLRLARPVTMSQATRIMEILGEGPTG